MLVSLCWAPVAHLSCSELLLYCEQEGIALVGLDAVQ